MHTHTHTHTHSTPHPPTHRHNGRIIRESHFDAAFDHPLILLLTIMPLVRRGHLPLLSLAVYTPRQVRFALLPRRHGSVSQGESMLSPVR